MRERTAIMSNAMRSQWLFPKNEANKVPGWRSDGKGLENKSALFTSDILDEDNMASDSATAVPSQQSVKAFGSSGSGVYLRSLKEIYESEDAYSLLSYIPKTEHSAIRAGTTTYDATARVQAAIDSGERLYVPRGTFLVSGLTGSAGLNMRGADWNSIIKLANGSNTSVLTFSAKSNVSLANFKVDGNTAGQTATTSHRGIYFVATGAHVDDLFLSRVCIVNTGGQGVMLSAPGSYQCGRNSTIQHCRTEDTGHTGFNGGCAIPGYSTLWFDNYAVRPANQGFKTGGDHIACETLGNGADTGEGEGFETEYAAGVDGGVITYTNCRVRDAGGGWRVAGSNHVVKMTGCHGENIHTSVVTVFGNLRMFTARDITGKNFGLRGTRGSSTGLDLVSLLDPDTATPFSAYLSDLYGEDDQGSPTGEHLVYMESGFKRVSISGNNDGSTLKYQPFNFAAQTDAEIRIRGYTKGWSAEWQQESTTSVGGSAGTYDLKSQTVYRAEAREGTEITFHARGGITGTDGTKELQFQVNSETAISLVTWTSGQTDSWTVQGRIWFPESNVVILDFDKIGKGGTYQTVMQRVYTIASNVDIAMKFIAVTGGTDTVTQTSWKGTGRS
jgi:hypothetical protein